MNKSTTPHPDWPWTLREGDKIACVVVWNVTTTFFVFTLAIQRPYKRR